MKDNHNINCIQFKDYESGFQYIMNNLKLK